MYKKKVETFDAIRWDGENFELVQNYMDHPCKKVGFGAIEVKVSDKEKVTIKKGHFGIRNLVTDEITTCDLETFEKRYQRAR